MPYHVQEVAGIIDAKGKPSGLTGAEIMETFLNGMEADGWKLVGTTHDCQGMTNGHPTYKVGAMVILHREYESQSNPELRIRN